VSLTKRGAASGQLVVNLNWSARPATAAKGGLFSRKRLSDSGSVDLDLACMFELADGRKGVVQALGNAFGSFDRPPYVQLDGDDRTGDVAAGETMRVNLSHLTELRRILVFTYIYEGAPNWASANAMVTLSAPTGPQVVVHLDEPDPGAPTCAIAMLENIGGELIVRREVRYIRGMQSALDRAYGWGMDWTPGRK
jgi:tellurite resistance protein TerA